MTNGRKRPFTVDDYLTEREKDPEYQKRMRERDARREREERDYREGAAEVLQRLADIGYPVRRISDLPGQYRIYRDAIPILLDWLERPEKGFKADVVRALSVRWAGKEVARSLVRVFPSAPNEGTLKWSTGDALGITTSADLVDEL